MAGLARVRSGCCRTGRRLRREGERCTRNSWIDDRLPELKAFIYGFGFDLVLLNAVWMHIRQADRARAFRKMVTLLKPGGLVMLSLRHGPGEPGREMFPVSLGESRRSLVTTALLLCG